MDIDKIIAEVERLDREATPGPWRVQQGEYSAPEVTSDSGWIVSQGCTDCCQYGEPSVSLDLIATYRTAAPLLAAEVKRLRAGGCARDQRTTQFCAEAVAKDAEIAKLRAELVECRQARDTLQAFLSSTSESLDKARAELRAKYSPDAMDLVGQRLVNARKSLDPDAPIWLTAAMDEAWVMLAFLRRNSAQQAARIEQQDDELAKLRDQILDYQQELHIAEQERDMLRADLGAAAGEVKRLRAEVLSWMRTAAMHEHMYKDVVDKIRHLRATMVEPTEQTGDEDSEQ